jgi:hypothetical protein
LSIGWEAKHIGESGAPHRVSGWVQRFDLN